MGVRATGRGTRPVALASRRKDPFELRVRVEPIEVLDVPLDQPLGDDFLVILPGSNVSRVRTALLLGRPEWLRRSVLVLNRVADVDEKENQEVKDKEIGKRETRMNCKSLLKRQIHIHEEEKPTALSPHGRYFSQGDVMVRTT